MNRDEIMWLLECCVLAMDGCSRAEMIKFGASPQIAEAGIRLYEYLSKKELLNARR